MKERKKSTSLDQGIWSVRVSGVWFAILMGLVDGAPAAAGAVVAAATIHGLLEFERETRRENSGKL